MTGNQIPLQKKYYLNKTRTGGSNWNGFKAWWPQRLLKNLKQKNVRGISETNIVWGLESETWEKKGQKTAKAWVRRMTVSVFSGAK